MADATSVQRRDDPATAPISDAAVELSGGDDMMGPFTIHPVERPRIVDLRLTSRHPTEPKPRTHSFSGDDAGDLSFLPYTTLELSFTANTPVADVAAAKASLETQGVRVEAIRVDEYTGRRFTFFADPDDLPLELYEA